MQSHFIHYHQRYVRVRFLHNIDDPWFAEMHASNEGFKTPKFHTTRSTKGPAADVSPGDTIWLVSQLCSPWGKLPPALDARIDVADCEVKDDGGFRYRAAKSSRWFSLLDCSGLLSTLETTTRDGQLNPLLKDPTQLIGHSLQSMRKLASGEPLHSWERELWSKDLHFISYRIKDGTQYAFEKAQSLVNEGIPFFWDRWSLPRRLAERRELVSDKKLDSYIKEILENSAVVWGIETPEYAAKESYSLKERDLAMRLGKYQSVSIKVNQKR